MTRPTLTPARTLDKPVVLPPRQPLPRAVIDATRPRVKLGLDVHLELIMAVSQQDHASLKAPRQFTRAQLVAHVRQLVAAGQQVFCVQESCGFGFTLHRELVAAGAQSFLITPIALNGARKTDKLDARALCLRLARWLDGNRDELAPIRIPSAQEQQQREGTRRRKFLGRLIRMLGNRGHGQARLSLDPNALRAKRKRLQALPAGARATGRSLRRSIRGCGRAWRNSGR